MGLFDRLRSAAPPPGKPDTSGQDATRLIDQGHALEAQGKLDEAMQCYREAIRLAPNPARGHLNRGNVLLLQGDLDGALDAFRTALELQPDYAGAYYNIGNALLGNRQFDAAVASYRKALAINPDYAEVHCSLGVALKELGQMDEAVACFRRALKFDPNLAEAHINLGNAQKEFGQLEMAVESYRNAIEIKPNLVEAHTNLGIALQGLGLVEDAMASYRQALEIKPDYAEAHNSLGNAQQVLGQLEGAVASYQRALEIKPDFAEAHCNLGLALQNLGQLEGAVASYRRALEIKPDFAGAHCNLGLALQNLGQLEGAVASYQRALEIKPDFAEAHCNLGLALQNLGQLEGAVASYQRALEIKPDFAEAHFNLGLLLLSLGRYVEAWPEFEARYDPDYSGRQSFPPNLPIPQWQGEPLTGKSIVVWPEQGFGDKIQFARYLPLLKMRGVSRLTLVCTPPLIALFEKFTGVDVIMPYSEADSLPFHDYWIFPMSLPLHFATTVETIPAGLPYLSVPPERLKRWHQRLPASGLKVGLVWKGSATHKNDANRSLPSLSLLAPLWSVPGVNFISLQKGQGEEEAASPPAGQPILHLGSDIMDFADTAAIVAQLDLVICIDTAIVHLAGALNKPCWVLLPATGTDWRWLRDRSDSPWYPDVVRLFRQTNSGDWSATIEDIAQNLASWAALQRNPEIS